MCRLLTCFHLSPPQKKKKLCPLVFLAFLPSVIFHLAARFRIFLIDERKKGDNTNERLTLIMTLKSHFSPLTLKSNTAESIVKTDNRDLVTGKMDH